MRTATHPGMHANTSLWRRAPAAPFPKLDRDLTVDVAVVGGGLTGLTTAVLLARLGKSVALLEAQRLGDGVTGDTSAHLTQMLDTRYLQLEKDFGRAATKDIAASIAGAIATRSKSSPATAAGSRGSTACCSPRSARSAGKRAASSRRVCAPA